LLQALISYGLHFMAQRGFTPVQTPFWLQQGVMAQCAQLSQFDEELYRCVCVVKGKGLQHGGMAQCAQLSQFDEEWLHFLLQPPTAHS